MPHNELDSSRPRGKKHVKQASQAQRLLEQSTPTPTQHIANGFDPLVLSSVADRQLNDREPMDSQAAGRRLDSQQRFSLGPVDGGSVPVSSSRKRDSRSSFNKGSGRYQKGDRDGHRYQSIPVNKH